MDIVGKTYPESDDDDYESYFLQPASSPYNIAEKVKEANEALFNEVIDEDLKEYKVQFREDLVDFEPDVTDDDVTSIESYNESVDMSTIPHNEALILDMQHSNQNYTKDSSSHINIFETVNEEDNEDKVMSSSSSNSTSSNSTPDYSSTTESPIMKMQNNLEVIDGEEEEDDIQEVEELEYVHISDDDDDECDNGIIEEVGQVLCGEEVKEKHIFKQKTIDLDDDEELSALKSLTDDDDDDEEDLTFKIETTNSKESKSQPQKTNNKKFHIAKPKSQLQQQQQHIECKNHCIEKLDLGLNLYINKLNIKEKPPRDCPALKLQKRNCCDKNPIKIEQRLPTYTGHKSEYGLSLTQLERRNKIKEVAKVRENKRYQILEEFKQRKMQQNEEIFCQWLKDISRRKKEAEIRNAQTKKCITPTLFPFPNSKHELTTKSRPTTAQLFPTHAKKKAVNRPHTSTACVYIEVPPHILQKGISVDSMLANKERNAKKLHILTFS